MIDYFSFDQFMKWNIYFFILISHCHWTLHSPNQQRAVFSIIPKVLEKTRKSIIVCLRKCLVDHDEHGSWSRTVENKPWFSNLKEKIFLIPIEHDIGYYFTVCNNLTPELTAKRSDMDADVCAGALLSLISVHQAKQLQQDNRAETRRRTRSKQRVAARRVRLHKLRQEWKQRTTQLRRARMERFEAHRIWMEGVSEYLCCLSE